MNGVDSFIEDPGLELRERIRQAELGAAVGKALTSKDALDSQLVQCMQAIVDQLDAAFARVWTLNEKDRMLELRASAGMYTHIDGPHARVPVGAFKIGKIAEERRPHLTNDVQNDPRVGNREWARREGMTAFAGYPLLLEERVVGVMAMFARRPLAPSTLAALASIANQVAVGIDRTFAERALREQTETLEQLHALGKLLAGELDLKKLLQAVTDAATTLAGAEFGSFFYNASAADGSKYMLYTLSGVAPEKFSSFPMPRATALFGPTFRGEGVVRLEDVKLDPRYGRSPPYHGMPAGHLPVASYLAVPVASRSGEVIGGLFFGHSRPGVFDERVERVVTGLAAQAAIAVDNARLYEKAQEAARHRERLLADVERERRRLDQVLTQAPAAIAVLKGPDHVFVSANALYKKLTGERDVVGKRIRDAFPELVGQGDHLDVLDEVYRTGQVHSRSEAAVTFARAGRVSEGFYNYSFQPLLDADGTISGIVIVAIEVTDQVVARHRIEHLASERSSMIQTLERTNAELDQFAYVASHDLKAPLRGIANLSQWLEEDLGPNLDGATKRQLELLRGRVQRMESLIEGILAYSRAGRVREKPERVDVGRLLAEVTEMLSASYPGARIEVKPGMPVLNTERVPLQQVFLNLVANALKHGGHADLVVRVAATETRDGWCFSVSDDGQGIAPEYHEKIWQLFQTLEPRDKVEGAGIGLSVVKKLVETRGGVARVESALGRGATFSFTWPAEGSPSNA